MKNDLLYLLERGPKSEIELAAFFGASHLNEVMAIIEQLRKAKLIDVGVRKVWQADNVIRWDYEFSLRAPSVSAA